MNITSIKGLKYPDEYFIKFFFKYQFHNKKDLTFLELGCSNGCNLILPYQYDLDTIGVDLDETLINYANENFQSLSQTNKYDFFLQDMRKFCTSASDIHADVLVLANSIYYIPKNDFIQLLRDIKQNKLIKQNIPFFLRFREIDDFRYAKGTKVEENTYIMKNGVTGEDGVLCKFYDTAEMIDILEKELSLRDFRTMNIKYDNIQNDQVVNNNDVVIWGTIN